MIRSLFNFGQNVVRRILPFGTLDEELNEIIDQDIISVGEFLETFRRVAAGSGSSMDIHDLTSAVQAADDHWFKLLISKDNILTLLNAPSKNSQKILNGLLFNNPKFLTAILGDSNHISQQFATGFRDSAIIRRHIYLLLVILGMHSYDGYVMIYKTVNLLQRERPNGMFQYISEEIADVTQSDRNAGADANLEALVPPMALMVVLFAGGNGFFIENHLRHQIQSSKLLTSIVDIVRAKFVEEKHSRRLELPTLKEPAARECTPQINRAIEILEQAERSRCDQILVWLEKFADTEGEYGLSENEYLLNLTPPQQAKSPSPPEAPPRPSRSAQLAFDDYSNYQSVAVDRLGPLKSDEDDHTETNPILPGPIGLSEAIAQKARSVEDVQPSSTAVEYSESPVDSTHSPSTDFVVQPASVSRSGGMAPPPAPPPPPPPVMNDHGSQVVDSKIIKSLLKPLRWTKLDTSADVVARTIWQPMNDTPPVDLAKLEELFKNERATGKYSGGAHHHGTTASESMDTNLLSSQTELRINVILKQFPDFTPEEIALRIERCDVADFDESQLKEFLAALPTGHEFEAVEKLKVDGKDITHLKPAESFLLHLLNVDHLKLRLEVMLFVVDFPVEERSIRKNCQDIINACKVIQSSEGYRRFLQIVLAVGNKMNEGRPIGNAVAFDTAVLPKLTDTSANCKPGYSLLSFVIDEVLDKDPDTLKFLDELHPIFEMARVSMTQIKRELLASREKYAQLTEEMQDVDEKAHRELERLLQGMRGRLNMLTNTVVAAQQRIRSLAMFLMEDPGTFALHEYIEMLSSFVQSAKTVMAAPARRGSMHPDAFNGTHEFASSPAFASALMKDPQIASVFQSLRNELHNTVAANPPDDGEFE